MARMHSLNWTNSDSLCHRKRVLLVVDGNEAFWRRQFGMRPMGPVHLARIALFPSTRFFSHRTGSGKLEMRSWRKFLLVRSAVFLLGALSTPTLAHAQSVFHFSKEVHWGDAVLPPGDYVITSLDVKNAGAVLTFATPNSPPRSPNSGAEDGARQEAVSSDSPSAEPGLFTIHNPRNQALPYAQAQMIYLSACRVVEQEFGQIDPMRPRLTLLLGADSDRVYYPKREIQLKKWDEYKFAQGVVVLAVSDLLPEDKKYSLSRLALLEAESTVDVRELKSSRTRLRAGPRN